MQVIRKRGKRLGDIRALAHALKPKRSILVVGAGASAHYLKRPDFDFDRYTIITCNSSCLLVNSHLWMSFDCESWRDSWWGEDSADFYLLGERQVQRAEGAQVYFPHDYYTFPGAASLRPDGLDRLEKFTLKGGATITGCAVQLALSFDTTKEIRITGCDFYDPYSHFYDDDKERDKRGRPWADSHIRRFAWLISQAEIRGVDTAHFGLTALAKFGVREIL